jgi:hypothetical protein
VGRQVVRGLVMVGRPVRCQEWFAVLEEGFVAREGFEQLEFEGLVMSKLVVSKVSCCDPFHQFDLDRRLSQRIFARDEVPAQLRVGAPLRAQSRHRFSGQ